MNTKSDNKKIPHENSNSGIEKIIITIKLMDIMISPSSEKSEEYYYNSLFNAIKTDNAIKKTNLEEYGKSNINTTRKDTFTLGDDSNNKIAGGPGNDTIIGKGGADSIWGGEGADILLGGDHKDYIVGNVGNDYISGGGDDDLLYGGLGDDMIHGGDGNDLIESDNDKYQFLLEDKKNAGNDHVFGGDGDDIITPGRGNDFLDGGTGDDTYRFYRDDAANIINEVAEGNNKLDLAGYSFSDLEISRHGSHLLITSKLKEDNLRILVKDQLGQSGPKINWLETKALSKNDPNNFRIQIPNIFGERTQDLGEIIDDSISFMLRHENEYGIDKVSSIFNPTKMSSNTEDNLAMLKEMISAQKDRPLESYSSHRFIPKDVVHFIQSLA